MTDMDRVRAAKQKARAQLLARPGVHAVGIGMKTVGGQPTGELAVVVLVVEKKLPGALTAAEMIPAEIDGVKTDVVERPIVVHCAEDTSKARPLEGGLQISPADRSRGTLGCFTTIPGLPNKVFALTNYHVVAIGEGEGTNLQLTTGGAAPSQTITVATEDGKATVEPAQSIAVVILRLIATGEVFYFYVQTAGGDTPAAVATKIVTQITGVNPAFGATAAGAVVTVTGPVQLSVQIHGRTVVNPEPSLTASVAAPQITLHGRVDGDFYGVFTTVTLSGLDRPTHGTFIAVPKGQPLENIAAAIAQSLSAPGVALSATSSGATVTVPDADLIECFIAEEVRIGQPEADFASACSDCCNDTIGQTVAGRYDLDAAVVELSPGLEYQADIKQFGHITGSRALTPADLTASITLRKRGRTTLDTQGTLSLLDLDGFSVALVDQGDPTKGTFAPRRYHDAFEVESPTLLVDGGDSGSVFLDGSTVVGLLFAGSPPEPAKPATPTTPAVPARPATAVATHIVPILQAFGSSPTAPMSIVTATADDQTHTVPAASGARSVLGASRNDMPSVAFGQERLREVEQAVASTPTGKQNVAMFRRHLKEGVHLVNHNRRVGAAWQRHGGPVLFKALLTSAQHPDARFPSQVLGRPLEECLEGIAGALRAHASPAFVRDLDRLGSAFAELGGKTYPELIETFRHDRYREAASTHRAPPAE